MNDLNWGMITDGGVFESLVHAILFSDVKDVILFGRPGKDAGQDVRTGDGKVIYQAKYHQNMTMSLAINDAKKEFDKIQEYRKPNHQNFHHWKNAERWVLMGNFEINPNDFKRWNDEIVPLFNEISLEAKFYSKTDIENMLHNFTHIKEAFFGGYNRIFLGLGEAYHQIGRAGISIDLSSDESVLGFDLNFIGRDKELQTVKDFVGKKEKCILPIVGSLNVGKSRLLYESLLALRDEGWRVFWALSTSMARSDRWFNYLNSSQKTCIAIDEPPDSEFLQSVLEQLSAIERGNWKVIVACDSAKERFIFSNIIHDHRVFEIIYLQKLNRHDSEGFIKSLLLKKQIKDNFINTGLINNIIENTDGFPGWIIFVVKLVLASKKWLEVVKPLDVMISDYLDKTIREIQVHDKGMVKSLLGWVALYNPVVLDEILPENMMLTMLAREMQKTEISIIDCLNLITEHKLVYNWGFKKRCYAVKPNLIRESILSKWLLNNDNDQYVLNYYGKHLIDSLISQQIVHQDKVLRSLSELSLSRVNQSDRHILFKSIFNYLKKISEKATEKELKNTIKLVKFIGISDPEAALDVLKCIIAKYGTSSNISDRKLQVVLFDELSRVLFYLCGFIENSIVARRYLVEFQILIKLENDVEHSQNNISNVKDYLRRIFGEYKYRAVFGSVGRDLILSAIDSPMDKDWEFISIIAKGLLSLMIEDIQFTDRFSINISRIILSLESHDWKEAEEIRKKLHEKLNRIDLEYSICCVFWDLVSASYQDMRAWSEVKQKNSDAYKVFVRNELECCLSTLINKRTVMSFEEIWFARRVWEWYLDSESDTELLSLAKGCEDIYLSFLKWPLHKFFKSTIEKEKEILIVEEIKRKLTSSGNVDIYLDFFNEVQNYLDIIRPTGGDLSDNIKLGNLADSFRSDEHEEINLKKFMRNILQGDLGNIYAVIFSVCIIQARIKAIKNSVSGDDIFSSHLKNIFMIVSDENKVDVLSRVYGCSHLKSVGQLIEDELDYIFEQELKAAEEKSYILLGAFAWVNWKKIQIKLDLFFSYLREGEQDLNNYFWKFVCAAYLSVLKYSSPLHRESLEWIIKVIKEYNLNGKFLNSRELNYLREQAGFKMTMKDMFGFIKARIDLKHNYSNEKKYDLYFEVLPYDFKICDWCQFDENIEDECEAFENFCNLALRRDDFLSFRKLPEYIVDLDPGANQVFKFIKKKLSNGDCNQSQLITCSYLAAPYSNTSEAWANIACLICEKAIDFSREEREHIYFCLSKKSTGVISSTPGQVADYYYQAYYDANSMNDKEDRQPLIEYRRWAKIQAERNLEEAVSLSEED